MPTRWNMPRRKHARFAIYKSYISTYKLPILVGTAIFLLLVVFYADYLNLQGDSNLDLNSKLEDNVTNVTVYSGNCDSCHNKSLSNSGVDTSKCNVCHMGAPHGDPKPPSRYNDIGKKTIHKQHSGSATNQKGCLNCHASPTCNRCHPGHTSTPEFNVSRTCQECHGGFPEPRGHQEQRSTFKESVHSWMGRCNTCHKGPELKFKTLAIYNLSNSSQLCSNCHSAQYNDPNHYSVSNASGIITEDKKCVDCHNPHAGLKPKFALDMSSIKTGTDSIINILVENAAWTVIIIILISSVMLEYIFRPKKGNIILSKRLRIEYDKSKARAIRIKSSQKLSASILRDITNVLDKNNVELLGMSADKEETILFVSAIKKDRAKIVEDIKSINGILKAEYTKDYDIR